MLAGTVDAARTGIALTAGGTAQLTAQDTIFVRTFVADPTSSARQTGVIGIVASHLATGMATYTGTAGMTVRDGTSLYDLNGAAAVAANIDGGTVDLTVSALTGTLRPAFAAPTMVNNIGTLTIAGAQITGTDFAGGTATLESTTLNAGAGLAPATTTDLQGAFFGTQGAETGGVFSIKDSTAQNFVIQGEFTAK